MDVWATEGNPSCPLAITETEIPCLCVGILTQTSTCKDVEVEMNLISSLPIPRHRHTSAPLFPYTSGFHQIKHGPTEWERSTSEGQEVSDLPDSGDEDEWMPKHLQATVHVA